MDHVISPVLGTMSFPSESHEPVLGSGLGLGKMSFVWEAWVAPGPHLILQTPSEHILIVPLPYVRHVS